MIVIPMAGLSSRFKKAGFSKPKYMLEAKGKTLFEHSILSFERYFDKEEFLFIVLDVFGTPAFVEESAAALGIKKIKVITLNDPTRGQAETVYLGLKKSEVSLSSPITIFNIDTFRPGFEYPSDFDIFKVDGYLETFFGEGSNWSNVLPQGEGSNKVVKTAEKQEISKFCCTGLYHFKSADQFCKVFEIYLDKPLEELQGGELYIAPMYNELISTGADIRFTVIGRDQVIFCGVPDEYFDFINSTL